MSDKPNAPREPTEAMLVAARDWSRARIGAPIGNDAARSCWQVMFDASDAILTAPVPEGEIEAVSDQRVAMLLHEEFPAWWNRETRKGPGLAARTTIEEAFRAGILAALHAPALTPPEPPVWRHDFNAYVPVQRAARSEADEAVAKARTALRPFANECDRQERYRNYRDGDVVLADCRITIGDLRRARTALMEAWENAEMTQDEWRAMLATSPLFPGKDP